MYTEISNTKIPPPSIEFSLEAAEIGEEECIVL